jgi:hypothetical protein
MGCDPEARVVCIPQPKAANLNNGKVERSRNVVDSWPSTRFILSLARLSRLPGRRRLVASHLSAIRPMSDHLKNVRTPGAEDGKTDNNAIGRESGHPAVSFVRFVF